MDSILKKVLKKITPTKVEIDKLNSVINLSKSKLEEQIDKMKINAEVFVGGSIAKGTWLKGKHDVDLFVRFDGYNEDEIGDILTKIVKSAFGKCIIMHGSRDYCKVNFKGYEIEFVPVMKIASPGDARNSMDASLFHVGYVKEKILRDPKLADEIRLFKAFARTCGVYGAETHISGISGYVSELLMIYFGSFRNLVEKSDELKPPIFIDIEHHYPSISTIKNALSSSKLKSPIILIDPVLKSRNACAALSYTTFSHLLLSLRLFKRKPSASFFRERKVSLDDIKKRSRIRGTILVMEKVKLSKDTKKDIFLAKLNKLLNRIRSSIEREGIEVYGFGYIVEDKFVLIYFEIETLKLSKVKKHYGPPVWVPKEHFDAFVKKWKKVYIEGVNLVCDVKRKETNVRKIVKSIVSKGLKDV
ncbi:MAG: CCA tRNA nucleotidyltransferase [Nanoarchaeota archaeon]|nr:CCA tRNA nucleotidyltransferase [Nanoarchaeota archaeon]